jgi:hypothetical protein
MKCFTNKHSEGKCISRERQRENSALGQEVNMKVNARAISKIIFVPENEIIKGTLGRDLKHTGLVSKVASVYRFLKLFRDDEKSGYFERMRYLG